ncbi:MAG: restriction endonuclease subunit S [Methanoregula sp.]|nr:restriction endonuclease subunit S [Methanoregula sp.]
MGERELPAGWEWKKIKDICQITNGRAFKPSDWSNEGLPIVRIQNLNKNSGGFNYCNFPVDERHIINSGQLLFSWSGTPGTSFGAFIWERGKAVLNQHIFRIELDEKKLDKKYLMAALNSRIQNFIQRAHGSSGLEHITKGLFENTFLPVPPLPIQRQIVAVLEQAETVKQQRQEADALAGALLQSVFYEMFGDTVRNEMGWDIVKLDTVCTKITDGTHITPTYIETGVPFLSVKNLTKGYLDFKNVKYISESEHRYLVKRNRPEKGDILYTKVGTYGKAEVVNVDKEFSIFVSLALLKPQHEKINSYYLKFILNSPHVKRQADNRIRGIGVPDLHLIEIKQFQIPLPPLALQQQFARVVQDVERIREQQVASGRQIEGLCEGLMARAFAGELRV